MYYDSGMGYQALLFCPDEKTARVVTQVLKELEFTVEPCDEPFAAVKTLMAQHFDALVVDCDNEQNATLLFKSARNSGSNQGSLLVAVVEGQAGVAKAFRIGANLVLTKPINVEQSKGTLRVARGLLRKAGTAKPAAEAGELHSVSAPRALPPQAATPAPIASSSAFELDAEPAPAPDAAEATLLEYMPDSVPSAGGPASPPAVSSAATKQYPWQPASKPLGEPMASALRRAAEAAGKSESDFALPSAPVALPVSTGAAAAPAPAKQKPLASAPLPESQSVAVAAAPAHKQAGDEVEPELTQLWTEEPDVSPPEVPKFSSLEETHGPASGGVKKFLLVAALILAVAGGHFGWSKFHSASSSPAAPKQIEPQVVAPATVPEATTPVAPANTTPQATAPGGEETEPEVSPASTQKTEPISATPGPKTSPSKPSAGLPAASTSSKTPPPAPVKTEAPIVVKSGVPKTRPDVQEPIQAPAAPVITPAHSADAKALSGIMGVTPESLPKPVPQTVKVSQGVSEGLLLKRVQPIYPPQARQMRLQGTVLLEASIGKDGSIQGLKQLSGDPTLGRAAMVTVRQWKYKPYYLNGAPVEVETQVTVNFKLP